MTKREMLINCMPGEECRIAVVTDGRLEEIYQERASSESHVSNIYKGRVVNVEPSIQAAFIDFGLERNGFLHITDLRPTYFPGSGREPNERVGRKTPRRDRPLMQKCLRRGQEILVQILKEGIGTKGPTLTTYLSIPGRFLVMMPHMTRLGVSRRHEDEEVRREMRTMLEQLTPPDGFGFILRTAALGRTKAELKRDLAYLQRLWAAIEKRREQTPGVGELYAESDLVVRTIRDVFTPEIDQIIVDDPAAAQRARDFFNIANPRSTSKVMLYKEAVPLFRWFDIEQQIENINRRTVELPSGGSLVIESTEALVAIDVNSGKMRDQRDGETTAFKANLEAADEICRQLRLRDLGGLIILDLIDMADPKHRRTVEQRFRENLSHDRARTRIAGISQFGILEMTRQRMRPSLQKSIYIDCASCQGTGAVKSPESVVLDVMRRLAAVLHAKKVARTELTISPDVAFQLLNRKRGDLVSLELKYGKPVMVRVNSTDAIDYIELAAFDDQGGAINTDLLGMGGAPLLESIDDLDPPERFGSEEVEPVEGAPARLPTDPMTDLASEPVAKSSKSTANPSKPTVTASGPSGSEDASRPRRRRRRTTSKRSSKKSSAPRSTDGNVKPASGNVKPASGNVKPASGNVKPASGNVKPVRGKVKGTRDNTKPRRRNTNPPKQATTATGAATGNKATFSRGYSNTLLPTKKT